MKKVRFFELDAARGIALILMIIYHTCFCLYFFGSGLVPWFNPVTVSGAPICFLFVIIAGVSISLMTVKLTEPKVIAKKLSLRALQIIACAMLVTLVTWIFYPEGFVIFGVLHLIGFSTLIMIPFVIAKIKPVSSFIAGAVVILLSFIPLHGPVFLLPFGFGLGTIMMIDYEPLFPWFGVILLGYTFGSLLYFEGKRCSFLSKLGEMPKVLAPLCFTGRHTLIIYLIHVPVIIAVLMLTGIISFR